MLLRDLAAIESDINGWIAQSSSILSSRFVEDNKMWVLKYMNPHFLQGFRLQKRLVISTVSGFTWGDGIYVSPLINPYSTMMYGRIGVLGWLDATSQLIAYDATHKAGIELYQEWIQHSKFLFRLLTTTIHSDRANRLLRNAFRRHFDIEVTFFRPDQYNKNYVSVSQDFWFVVSDWQGTSTLGPVQRPKVSSKVKNCEWVALVGEQFQESDAKTHFTDLIGPHLHPTGRTLSNAALATQLRSFHAYNVTGANPPRIAHILA